MTQMPWANGSARPRFPDPGRERDFLVVSSNAGAQGKDPSPLARGDWSAVA